MKTYQIIFVGLMIALMSITDAFAQNWTRRTRVHDLNSGQRSTLNTVMLQYLSQQNSSGEYTIVKQHGDYDAYIHNYNETFLGWHRQYLAGMERYVMARISQGLRDSLNGLLPYWRPTTKIPREFFYNAILPGFTAPQDSTPYDKNGTTIYNINNYNGINFNGPYFCNNYNNNNVRSCGNISRSIPIDKFATDLECFHNTVHGAIGGDMAVSAVSPSATIFWIWHAWVDEVYWSYEICRNSYATLPYSMDFENGLDQYWYIGSSDSVGRVRVTSNFTPHSGSRHLTMDSKISNHYVTNEAILSLNLSGTSNVLLTFWWKEFNDEYQASDGVYISDGGPYVKVMNLGSGSYNQWEQKTLNISQLASNNGLSLNSTFKIKFQQRDNWWITSDGFAFDDIYVSQGSVVNRQVDNSHSNNILVPDQIDLRAYPNPFNASTTIEYTLPETTEVILTVSDITGKEVRRLVNGSAQGAGLHQTVFHAEDLPSGVYFYTLEAQGIRKTDKLMLQR